MSERNKRLCLCLFLTIFGVLQVCNGYSSSAIKDYSSSSGSKEHLVSSSSLVNKFEDNEIRGKSNSTLKGEISLAAKSFRIQAFIMRNTKKTLLKDLHVVVAVWIAMKCWKTPTRIFRCVELSAAAAIAKPCNKPHIYIYGQKWLCVFSNRMTSPNSEILTNCGHVRSRKSWESMNARTEQETTSVSLISWVISVVVW